MKFTAKYSQSEHARNCLLIVRPNKCLTAHLSPSKSGFSVWLRLTGLVSFLLPFKLSYNPNRNVLRFVYPTGVISGHPKSYRCSFAEF